MTIGNVQLMQECFLKQSSMRTVKMKYSKNFKLNGLNGHFIDNACNSVSCACLVSLAAKRKKGSTIQEGYRKWGTHARVLT